MWLLPERRDPDGEGAPRSESKGERRRDSSGHVDGAVPVLHERSHAARNQALPGRRSAMTPDAKTAFERAGFSRRDFLKTSGVLVVSFGAAAVLPGVAQGPFDTRPSHIDPRQLDSWIAIAADGKVTAYTGKCDLGQGMLTAQTQLVAEELSVPPSRVTLIQCDTSVCPDQGTTSGCQSTPTNFNDRNLAQAAATAREALLALAARRFNVNRDQLTLHAGLISVNGDSSKRVAYGDLLSGQAFNLQVDQRAKRKPAG